MSDRKRRPEVTRLFHYTCRDAAQRIDGHGVLVPSAHPWWPTPLLWLTDLENPLPEYLFGVPTGLLGCDRSAVRYEVQDITGCLPWTAYARTVHMHATVRDLFEGEPGTLPAHWWISLRPLPVVAAAGALL